MADLLKMPGVIKTMVESVFMAELQESGCNIDTPRMHWFRTCLIEHLSTEIFGLLCDEERAAIKNWLELKKEFILTQLVKWHNYKKIKDYEKADLIREWLMQTLSCNPENNLEKDL